jgi:hypothetical protein
MAVFALIGIQSVTAQERVIDSVKIKAIEKERLEQQLKNDKEALKAQERAEKQLKDAEKDKKS